VGDLNTAEARAMQRDKLQIARRRNLAPHPAINLTAEDTSVRTANGHFMEDGFRHRSGKVVGPIDCRDHGPSVHQGSKSSQMGRLVELPLVIFRAVASNNDAAGFPAFDPRIKVRGWARHHDGR
jgi:hypothetical protein